MNIEKIKNYNQKLLAVIGTLAVLIAVAGIVLFTFIAIVEFIPMLNKLNKGILSDKEIEIVQHQNNQKQLISYEMPILVDSINLIYVIPVLHKTLTSPELIGEGILTQTDNRRNSKSDWRYSKNYSGNFNNLLVFDFVNKKTEKLFQNRIDFENIQIEYFKDDILILFRASPEDTYQDGVLNQLDYKSLFIYSFNNKILTEVKLENADVSQTGFIENSKDMLIKFGVDYNRDGKFDAFSEPSVLRLYEFKSGELKTIVSSAIDAELQMMLDGTKN